MGFLIYSIYISNNIMQCLYDIYYRKEYNMIQLGEYILPEHISYSALNTYLTCGYQYYLGRLLNLPETPSVWSVGGSAFHKAAEYYDKGEL